MKRVRQWFPAAGSERWKLQALKEGSYLMNPLFVLVPLDQGGLVNGACSAAQKLGQIVLRQGRREEKEEKRKQNGRKRNELECKSRS